MGFDKLSHVIAFQHSSAIECPAYRKERAVATDFKDLQNCPYTHGYMTWKIKKKNVKKKEKKGSHVEGENAGNNAERTDLCDGQSVSNVVTIRDGQYSIEYSVGLFFKEFQLLPST